MKSKLPRASVVAIGATLLTALLGAGNTGAAAQDKVPDGLEIVSRFTPEYTSRPLVQPLPAEGEDATGLPLDADDPTPEAKAGSLADLVSVQPRLDELPRELQCLAGAVYFEARGESLAGQLAVGRVVINRAKSGRFPASYCGVVYQRSQFSFIRGGQMPTIDRGSRGWQNAVAMARIADANAYPSVAEGALFFHATRVSPNWRLTRVARVDNHVFYR